MERERFEGIAPEERIDEKKHVWEERVQALAMAAKIDFKQLGAEKSDSAKVLLAAAMKQRTSASNGWLAERLLIGKPATLVNIHDGYSLPNRAETPSIASCQKLSMR